MGMDQFLHIRKREESGFRLNDAGGKITVSRDGLPLQSSTVAGLVTAIFGGGIVRVIPGSYVEFAECGLAGGPDWQGAAAGAVRGGECGLDTRKHVSKSNGER